MRGIFVVAVVAVLVPWLAEPALAGDILVPRDHRNLQDALDEAGPGDRVVIQRRTVRGEYEVTRDGIEIVGGERGTRFAGGKSRRARRTRIDVAADGVTVRHLDFSRSGITVTGDDFTAEDCTFRKAGPGQGGAALVVIGDRATARDLDLDLTTRDDAFRFGMDVTGDDAVVTGCTVTGGEECFALDVQGDRALVEGNDFEKGPRHFVARLNGDGHVVRDNAIRGARFTAFASDSLVSGNVFTDADFGRPALYVVGSENAILGNEVTGSADSGIVVYGDGNAIAGNGVTDAGTVIEGVRYGNGFVVRGSGNLLANNESLRVQGEGFRIMGNTWDEREGEGYMVPGSTADPLGPGNELLNCSANGSGRCGLGNWTLGTCVTGSTFYGNGADIVDTGGFDVFTDNRYITGGPGFTGGGTGVLAPDWGALRFNPEQLNWE